MIECDLNDPEVIDNKLVDEWFKVDEISFYQKFQILTSRSVFEISDTKFAWDLHFYEYSIYI